MKDKLNSLFKFIQANREYNKSVQEKYYNSIIKPYDNTVDKVVSLVYHIANTQNQPKIDLLAEFYKNLYNDRDCMNSFEGFIGKDRGLPINYKGLFQKMYELKGWGGKTSALFTKSIFHLHNSDYPQELRIWKDAPSIISSGDDFYLPVDTVIIYIFEKLDPSQKWNFKKINKKINIDYSGSDIEVWDDLWFWGFITQRGTGSNRISGWNENKYWSLLETDKDSTTIKKVKGKAEDFLRIILE